jgi:hypothetical protein
MGQAKLVEKSDFTISEPKCKHQFGFLSQRPKGVAIPEECFTCERMLDCTVSKPEDETPTVEIREIEPEIIEEEKQYPEAAQEESEEEEEYVEEEIAAPVPEPVTPEPEQVVVVREVEEKVVEEKKKTTIDDVPKVIKEQVAKKVGQVGQILKLRIQKFGAKVEASMPEEKTAVTVVGGDFCVEGAGALYNHWSGTVIVDEEIVESWGKKIKEVELLTEKGRITICKVHPVPNLAPSVIQVPDKIKASLRIQDGAHIKVKPIQK